MKKNIFSLLMMSLILMTTNSCGKKDNSGNRGFAVTQFARCEDGNPIIKNLSVDELYIFFESETFVPAPNTWYRASNPDVPCGSCDLLVRYKTGSDVSPKDASYGFGADMNVVLTSTNLCK